MAKLDGIDPETIRKMYWDDNLNLIEIASALGVSITAVRYYMQKHNIKRRSMRNATIMAFEKGKMPWLRSRFDADAEIIKYLYWDEGLSIKKISKIFEVSHDAIHEFMKRKDIKRRTVSEGKLLASQKNREVKMSNEIIESKPTTTRGKAMEKLEQKADGEKNEPIWETQEYIKALEIELENMTSARETLSISIQKLDAEIRETSFIRYTQKEVKKQQLALFDARQKDNELMLQTTQEKLDDAKFALNMLTELSEIDTQIDNLQVVMNKLRGKQITIKKIINSKISDDGDSKGTAE